MALPRTYRRIRRIPRRLWIPSAILAFALIFHHVLLQRGVEAGASAATGTHVWADSSSIGTSAATFRGVTIRSTSDEPIARVERLDVHYDVWKLLDRRYVAGIVGVDATRPSVTILRRADGSYNLPLPASGAKSTGALSLILHASIRDGSISIADESSKAASPLTFDHLNAVFDVDTSARTHYAASLAYREGAREYPIQGSGTADAASHTMLQRWSASRLPVARIGNFVANDPAIRVESGELAGIDAIYAGLPATGGAMDSHLAATAELRDAAFALAGLAKPVHAVNGRFDLTENGVTTRTLKARIGTTTIRIAGGIFDLAHPTLRVAAAGHTDLAQLHALVANPALASLRGRLDFSALAIGPGTGPFLLASLGSNGAAYDGVRIDRARAFVAVDARGADLVGFHARAGGANAFSVGRIAFARGPQAVSLLLHASAPSSAFAPAAAMLSGMSFSVNALAFSDDPAQPRLSGVLGGRDGSQSLLAAFDASARGTSTFGPLRVEGSRGSLYARGSFDLSHRSFSALASARGLIDGALLARGSGENTDVSARGTIGGGRVVAYGRLGPHGSLNVAANDADFGSIHAGGATFRSGKVSFGATLAGTLASPSARGAFAVGRGSFADAPVDASAAFAVRDATIRLSDALASVDSALVDLDGRVRTSGVPAYDLAMRVHAADIAELARTGAPQLAPIVDGSVDADLHVTGAGAQPYLEGSFAVPEGSFDGQAFRSLTGAFAGGTGGIDLTNGSLDVGSTHLAFDGRAGPEGEALALHGAAVDLSDFDDLFDRGDVLSGRGRFDAQIAAAGEHLVASSGNGRFTDARVLQFPLGDTDARWNTSGGALAMHAAFGGASGMAGLDGSVRLADSSLNLRARARDVDVARWLPLAGATVPVAVTGRADADVTARGRYPDLDVTARADLRDGTVGTIPVQAFSLAAHVNGGRGRIDSARLRIPNLDATAGGTFGLAASAPLSLSIHATSPDVGALAKTLTGKPYDAAGVLDTTVAIAGTRDDPRLSDRATLDRARYGTLLLPHASAVVTANRRQVALAQAELDFSKGRLTASGAAPIRQRDGAFALAPGAVAAHLGFDDVELSNFASLLPPRSRLSGRVDGSANLGGTTVTPQLSGTLALAGGAFSGPQEETPISALDATLTAHGSRIDLTRLHGNAGSGTIDVTGFAAAPSLLDPRELSFAVNGAAHGAQVDLPAYFKGQVDGTVALARTPHSLPRLTGDVSVSHARMPVSAFLQASGPSSGANPPNLALDLKLRAGSDVRVQSPNVDVGGAGSLRVAGTLDAPSVAGRIDATGGSVDFYRNFRLQRGSVTFDPSDGLVPAVRAVASTYVSDPETNVTIRVSGPVTAMQLDLSSDPSYDRTQILGLLAGVQNFGTIPGVGATTNTPFSASGQAENLAFGQVNQAFTRELLDPLSANLGSALGLANLDIYNDVGEGFGFGANQKFGQHLSATGSESFGPDRRQDVEVAYHRSDDATAVQLHLYQQNPIVFEPGVTQASVGNVVFNVVPGVMPPIDGGGTHGVGFSFQRRWW